ncbi:hypothetical protein PF005_g14793 [Phytophthora fragariae]|uniref:Uncharacterized protein n=2 Tax=Phytophthora TaxID=4783 RepID=A0A6A3TI00_9STRA|nr:hypothetical protein PF003_g22636 [Phytophthora fragariae]KAE9331162.1 hypothetical protein PR003_g15140 [Phytophthora rubi]KAE8933357.1 hypothetical protein PF009_g16641 [Phytophthora fragariae]KAE9000091.1 hypothetical protein PF011_g14347 [Phytophthora fragariae]KAE9100492.1 hypothetical protein PF010_g14801 [Phytophthora fragariae]
MDVSRLPAALWLYVQWALETHGWKLLGAALLFYAGRGRLREFAARRHQQRALAEANDPARVAVLRRETARVRSQQQQQLQAKANKAQVKVEKAA